MRRSLILLAFPLALGLVACPKPTQPKGSPADSGKTAAAPQSRESSLRLDPEQVVASWDGGKITYGELRERGKPNLAQIERKYLQDVYLQEQQLLDSFVIEALIKAEAKKAGKTEDEYFKSMGGEVSVTEDEVKAFYESNVKSTGEPFEQHKAKIQEYLTNRKMQTNITAKLKELRRAANVTVELPAPESVVTEFDITGRPFKGSGDAVVSIVEFSDFQCPYCSKAATAIGDIVEKYPNDVKLYYMHFPLSFHPQAMPAAIASQCAHMQNKFWPFHDEIFDKQASLSADVIKAAAAKVGLNTAQFEGCLKDPLTAAAVKNDMDQARDAGVGGTPSFFINGVFYPQGTPTPEVIEAVIAKLKG